jgi:hypothetical protein
MRPAVLMAAAPAALAVLAACGSGPPACARFVGDPGRDIELQVVVLGADGTTTAIGGGARVPLVKPPQGGRVLFVGVRARNLDICSVEIVGALRDPATQAVLGLEGRPVALTVASDGWAEASATGQPSSYANVAVCPNFRSARDIDEEPYELLLQLTDTSHRMGQASLTVTPFCAEPDSAVECQCICKKGYVLGSPCLPPDGGV